MKLNKTVSYYRITVFPIIAPHEIIAPHYGIITMIVMWRTISMPLGGVGSEGLGMCVDLPFFLVCPLVMSLKVP